MKSLYIKLEIQYALRYLHHTSLTRATIVATFGLRYPLSVCLLLKQKCNLGAIVSLYSAD